ncbi:LPS assembly lipoprotein LptE [Sphingomonas jatrophae]|uniref:LPS-assembly lipoprotein n=1 Tax=Sphingomonas jatrophae TaxID=1166337 RepID=A0A1I6LNY1_9SPHN|nr:LPS assembly lipoprotein LptE [Sphingomonas jatrophae]SFS04962.1 LPS-assembly lipoprotein [Sphingomonas jatrophae]
MRRIAALLLIAATLPSCGLQPLYAGGGTGVAASGLDRIAVADMPGRAGWLMKAALTDRLRPSGEPVWRLEVALDDQIAGFGIRSDYAVTRERRTLRARYRLVDAAQGTVLLDATAGSDAGVDVVSSDYATIAAEQTALERLTQEVAQQITTRLALYVRRTAAAGK